jgi:hypothetical protein
VGSEHWNPPVFYLTGLQCCREPILTAYSVRN